MTKSQSITELAKALVSFKTQHPKIELDEEVRVESKKGRSYNYRYASLPNLKEQVEPFLFQNGLVVSQHIEESGKLTTMLLHSSGEFMESTMNVNEMKSVDEDGTYTKSGPQEYGSLISYAKRYAYSAVLGLIGDSSGTDKSKPKDKSQTFDNADKQQGGEKDWLNRNTSQWNAAVEYMCTGEEADIKVLLEQYRINKSNKEELIAAKENHLKRLNTTVLTEEISKEINGATNAKGLRFIYDKYPNLQENEKFREALEMRRTIVNTPNPTTGYVNS